MKQGKKVITRLLPLLLSLALAAGIFPGGGVIVFAADPTTYTINLADKGTYTFTHTIADVEEYADEIAVLFQDTLIEDINIEDLELNEIITFEMANSDMGELGEGSIKITSVGDKFDIEFTFTFYDDFFNYHEVNDSFEIKIIYVPRAEWGRDLTITIIDTTTYIFEGTDMTQTFNVDFEDLLEDPEWGIGFGPVGSKPTELETWYLDPGKKGDGGGLTGYGSWNNRETRQLGDVKEGSIIVTLYWQFLETLSNGNYQLSVWGPDDFLITGSPIIINQPQSGRTGGGSGSDSRSDASFAPIPTAMWLERAPAQNLAAAAKRSNIDFVRTRHNYTYGVRGDAWDRLAGLRYEHDTMENNSVAVRLYADNPAGFGKDILVSGWTGGIRVSPTLRLFERHFANKLQAVVFEQKGEWGQVLRAAARLDLTGMDAKNLVFYAYDSMTNTYKQIKQPNYKIDSNGYVHFYTGYAGAIVVSDGVLQRK
ncbi:MAG: hypothetical protein FWH02_04665 [Oscillospiraceae bacterium]|nr:hypothetical protein [Oscillospiraceae bacterium]